MINQICACLHAKIGLIRKEKGEDSVALEEFNKAIDGFQLIENSSIEQLPPNLHNNDFQPSTLFMIHYNYNKAYVPQRVRRNFDALNSYRQALQTADITVQQRAKVHYLMCILFYHDGCLLQSLKGFIIVIKLLKDNGVSLLHYERSCNMAHDKCNDAIAKGKRNKIELTTYFIDDIR
ncbi:MAG: hypothetical protein IT434_17935 [Phycisphaerales bacterium]|nr:hypothetical protein [Phycisphaerales bacterium]